MPVQIDDVIGVRNYQCYDYDDTRAGQNNFHFLVCRINPTYFDAVLNLAGVMNDQGKVDEAEGFYKRALNLQPRNADAYNNYAVFLGKVGEN